MLDAASFSDGIYQVKFRQPGQRHIEDLEGYASYTLIYIKDGYWSYGLSKSGELNVKNSQLPGEVTYVDEIPDVKMKEPVLLGSPVMAKCGNEGVGRRGGMQHMHLHIRTTFNHNSWICAYGAWAWDKLREVTELDESDFSVFQFWTPPTG